MDPLPLLRDLVATNSVNPSLVPGAPGEAAVADVVDRWMRRAGMDVVRQLAAPDRPNVIGVLEGASPGPSLMLCGHIDTVGVEAMDDPFTPREAGGRLYGRGAQDMKGGVAAMIAAAAVLAPHWRRGRLLVAAVVDEEYESIGAEALVRDWRADAAIVTEPTDLRVAIGHKGFAWLEIVTEGRAAHGSRPEDGRDAIARMGRVLVALEARDRELRARPPVPFQGTASLHASLIHGGRELSSYPDRCTLQMERRTVSGETESAVTDEVNRILASLAEADPEFRGQAQLKTMRPAYCLDPAHAFTRTVCAAAGAHRLTADPIGMSFWTDAAILGAAGIPSLLFGPGGAGLHSVEEYVNVADLVVCRDVICDVARGWGA
jgi:acetylornithine deacetylase